MTDLSAYLAERRGEHLTLSNKERDYDPGPFCDVMWTEYPAMLDVIEAAAEIAAKHDHNGCHDCNGGVRLPNPEEPRACGCWGTITPMCFICQVPWPCSTKTILDRALDALIGSEDR